jgi:hypothetical protein
MLSLLDNFHILQLFGSCRRYASCFVVKSVSWCSGGNERNSAGARDDYPQDGVQVGR